MDQIDYENMNMDMDMPDEADDTNVNGSNENGFGLFGIINYVTTSIQDFVQEEREEFEADANDAKGKLSDACWEVGDDALPPIQFLSIPQWSPLTPYPQPPPNVMNGVEVIRGHRKISRDKRKKGGMGLLKRLISGPERGPRILKKKEQKPIYSFGVVQGDNGPDVSKLRYNKGIGNRQKWASSGKRVAENRDPYY